MSSSASGSLALSPASTGRAAPRRGGSSPERAVRARKYGVRTIALGYLALLLLAPVAMIFYRTFEHGLTPVWNAIQEPNAQHAFWLSLEIVAISVPLNTVFGIGMALLLERGRFKGKWLLGLLIDLPFAISPVVIGLALVLAYGKTGWLGDWLAENGIQVIFSVPGMVLATAIVSLPFVARETIPVLRELGTDAEQAASTLGASGWQAFWRITLP
ncbi:MAG TPA: ABC transporter permease subunit, partial [Solirubrobacteraceae bacterium]|nr:ABC transporter permease subunit [Solirubrobacteraceae bacterium]